jgi:hypothetical protein
MTKYALTSVDAPPILSRPIPPNLAGKMQPYSHAAAIIPSMIPLQSVAFNGVYRPEL